jgi:hypothetical protein
MNATNIMKIFLCVTYKTEIYFRRFRTRYILCCPAFFLSICHVVQLPSHSAMFSIRHVIHLCLYLYLAKQADVQWVPNLT